MNRDCKGDWFPKLGKYRCLGDGSWLTTETLPTVCDNCGRSVDPLTHEAVLTREVLVTEVYIDPYGWIEMEHKETGRKAA